MGRKPLLESSQVLEAIHRWIVEHGNAPTIDELRKVLRVGSTRTVLRYLRALEDTGEIERWEGARGLRLRRALKKGLETVAVPIVGEAPAGPLMVAEQNIEGWVRFPKESLRPRGGRFYLLRVRGDSMNKARVDGIRLEGGDLVLVEQQPVAQPGDIVVALVDGAVTIKRLQKGPTYWVLKPESSNPEHHPIVVGRAFGVQGTVRRVLKKGAALVTNSSGKSTP